jgi:DNA-binding LytR/AlgR family response regulator
MEVLIIEDESPAAHRLSLMLKALNRDINILAKLDSVESAVAYLQTGKSIDLIFMDIQLADGLSFDIFQQTTVTTPVIFTTAFDQYTLKAFKVNSIDYLLKPIVEEELEQAVNKYKQIYLGNGQQFSEKILQLVKEMNTGAYAERLLIKRGQQLSYLKTESTAYCFADGKLCYAVDFNNNKHLLETTLTQLEEQLQPRQFYRVNRNLLVNIESIKKVHTWLGGRLKLELQNTALTETIVSRERVNGFKNWLGQ